jgi:outer membrane receptor protein involved in Fe transport
MTRDQIEQLRPYHSTDAFRYLRGFAVVPFGARDIVVTTRGPGGFGGCLPQVYVDGNRMFVRSPEDQADALETVPAENIEAIEAYQGAASIPPEYNATGSVCGVLLIWTRS